MPWGIERHYLWEGINDQGRKVSGTCRAPSDQALKKLLLEQSLSLLSFKCQLKLKQRAKKMCPLEKKIAYIQQLQLIVSSSLPLSQGLTILASRHSNPREKQRTQSIQSAIQAGQSLSQALSQHPDLISLTHLAFIQAGELHGNMAFALSTLSKELQQQLTLRSTLKGILYYPLIVLSLALVITLGLLLFVIPQFNTLYQQFNGALPSLTRIMLNLSDCLRQEGALIGVFSSLAGCLSMAIYKNCPPVQVFFHSLVLRIPFLKNILLNHQLSQWYGLCLSLYDAGITFPLAMQHATASLNLSPLKKAFDAAHQKVEQGTSVSESFLEHSFIPTADKELIHLAEESGQLSQALSACQNYHNEKMTRLTQRIKLWLEPCIMLVLAGIIGTLVLAIYLPIFNIGQLMT